MERDELFGRVRVLIVAGKGGVGKTTVAATIARAASARGKRVLAIDVEGKNGLATAFGHGRLSYDEITLVPASDREGGVIGRTLPPDEALVEYLDDHGLRRLGNRLARTGLLDLVATATPGIKDILVLGKIRQLSETGVADLVVVDAPAAGHAIRFLRAPRTLVEMARVGPIRTQSEQALELLRDGDRSRVVLVALPEETPVTELVETAFALEDDVGVQLGPIVVNGCEPPLDPTEPVADLARSAGLDLDADTIAALETAAAYRRTRADQQRSQIERLSTELPLPTVELPWVYRTADGGPLVDELAGRLDP